MYMQGSHSYRSDGIVAYCAKNIHTVHTALPARNGSCPQENMDKPLSRICMQISEFEVKQPAQQLPLLFPVVFSLQHIEVLS